MQTHFVQVFLFVVHQQNVHRPPQFTTREWWNGSNRNQEQPSDDCEDILGVYNFCCILCFLPCIFNSKHCMEYMLL